MNFSIRNFIRLIIWSSNTHRSYLPTRRSSTRLVVLLTKIDLWFFGKIIESKNTNSIQYCNIVIYCPYTIVISYYITKKNVLERVCICDLDHTHTNFCVKKTLIIIWNFNDEIGHQTNWKTKIKMLKCF